MDRQLNRLVDLINKKFVSNGSANQKPMDFAAATHLFALDIIGDLTFGKAFGFLDEGDDTYGFIKWNEDFLLASITAAVLPTVARIVEWWPLSELLPKATDPTGLGKFIKYADYVLRNWSKCQLTNIPIGIVSR